MSILKLEPGQRVNLSITQVSTVEGKFGPQYLFTGSTPDESDVALYLNVKTADQQFSRLGMSALDAEGQTVEIERIEKGGVKYTNINRPSGASRSGVVPVGNLAGPVQTATASSPASTAKQAFTSGPHIAGMDAPVCPVAEPEYGDEAAQQKAVDALKVNRLDALVTLYRTCFTEAVSVAKLVPATTPVTHEGISAMAATIFIAAKDRAA